MSDDLKECVLATDECSFDDRLLHEPPLFAADAAKYSLYRFS